MTKITNYNEAKIALDDVISKINTYHSSKTKANSDAIKTALDAAKILPGLNANQTVQEAITRELNKITSYDTLYTQIQTAKMRFQHIKQT
jgi:ArsR family metal-binding transcriptional regulator